MDTQGLSKASAVVLSAYLPYVWHGNLPSTGDKVIWEAAAGLYQVMRPSLEGSGDVVHPLEQTRTRAGLLKSAIEQPNESTLVALAGSLAALFEADQQLAYRIETLIASGPFASVLREVRIDVSTESLMRQYAKVAQQVLDMRSRSAGQARPSGAAATCQDCGRSDSSLRIVAYPFVVSVILMTFRRGFAGIWCGRHATMRRLLASLISVVAGWWGFPFGFIFTPVALLTLARGGEQPAEHNRNMLMDLAQHKLKMENNPAEALRCLEAAMSFGSTPTLQARLRELYAITPDAARTPGLPRIFIYPLTLLGATVIGLAVGIVNYLIIELFSFLPERVDLVVAIITWAPFVAAMFAAGLILNGLLESALMSTRTTQRTLGSSLAVVASLLAIYMIPSGEALADLFLGPEAVQTFSSPVTALVRFVLAVMWGGANVIASMLSDLNGGSVIFLVLLLGMAALYMIAGVSTAGTVSRRLQIPDDLRPPSSLGTSPGLFTGWLAVIGSVIVFGVVFLGAALLSDFQYGSPATLQAMGKTVELVNAGKFEAARTVLEGARAEDPGSVFPEFGLAIVELREGNCEESLRISQSVVERSPIGMQGIVHSYIADSYACLDRYDDTIASYEKAAEVDPESADHLIRLGLYYLWSGQSEKSEETLLKAKSVDPSLSGPHAALAILYYTTGQADKEQIALRDALERKTADDNTGINMLAVYYNNAREFVEAETYIREMETITPGNPGVLEALAHNLIAQGRVDEAREIAEQLVAGESDPQDAHLLMSSILIEEGDLDGALMETELAAVIRPDNSSIHTERAWIHYYQKDYDRALEEGGLAFDADKYNASALAVRALSHLALGKSIEAQKAAEAALKLEPTQDTSHYVMAMIYLEQGKKNAARVEFEKFLKQSWDRAYIRDLIADAQARLADLPAQ